MSSLLHRNATLPSRRLLGILVFVLLLWTGAAWAASSLAHGASSGFIDDLLRWYGSSKNWHGSDGIPNRVIQHIGYTVATMVVSLIIALPIGIGLGHTGRGGLLAINVANIGRAVPSFGLILLMFLLAGFGFVPALVALVALAIPPIITNSYVGMQSVDPAVRQAAIAVGMSGWQQLWRVELPIALPLVMAGIRTSAVQVVSTATLAAYIGLGGLGRYLIDGLAQHDLVQVVGGAILVAILAIITEAGLAFMQRGLVSKGVVS